MVCVWLDHRPSFTSGGSAARADPKESNTVALTQRSICFIPTSPFTVATGCTPVEEPDLNRINVSVCRRREILKEIAIRNSPGGAREWDSLTPAEVTPSALKRLHTAPFFPVRRADGVVHRAVGLVDMVQPTEKTLTGQ
jgi:hypothetical protein